MGSNRSSWQGARAWTAVAGLLALAAGLASCTSSYYRRDADEEVYGVIGEKQEAAGLPQVPIEVERPAETLRQRLLERLAELEEGTGIEGRVPPLPGEAPSGPRVPQQQADQGAQPLGAQPPAVAPLVLTLEDCLNAAAENSRDYQREKENVYLAALNLTLERYQFHNQFFGTLSGEAGQSGAEERSGSVSADTGFTRSLASGARILFDIGTTLFRAFTGGADDAASSLVDLTITQPLLRGAGRAIVEEPLTQSERDALYAVRSFERFKRTLAVRIASEMYGVLQQADSVKNAKNNYDSLMRTRVQTEELAKAGRSPEFEVDQARQRELSARDGWIRQLESYRASLDRFKITLGLPTDAEITVDESELARLSEGGLAPLEIDTAPAVRLALEHRLDLRNSRDGVADAERKVEVARNALLTGLDLSVSSSVRNEANVVAALEFGDGTYLVGADIDLPLDRKSERNAFRSALISLERARRSHEQTEDNVKFEVRQAKRNLAEAEESYRIRVVSLELAERRVESTLLLQQAGRAATRDILEAQADLLDAQNGVTQALVTYTIARLELLRDLGLLTVDQEGLNYDASAILVPEARP